MCIGEHAPSSHCSHIRRLSLGHRLLFWPSRSRRRINAQTWKLGPGSGGSATDPRGGLSDFRWSQATTWRKKANFLGPLPPCSTQPPAPSRDRVAEEMRARHPAPRTEDTTRRKPLPSLALASSLTLVQEALRSFAQDRLKIGPPSTEQRRFDASSPLRRLTAKPWWPLFPRT